MVCVFIDDEYDRWNFMILTRRVDARRRRRRVRGLVECYVYVIFICILYVSGICIYLFIFVIFLFLIFFVIGYCISV